MDYRKYNLIIGAPLLILFAVFVALGVRLQPLNGDLTRLGGFTENDFGWNDPQERFSTMLYTFDEGKKYDQYYDVVVLGDSFSITFPRAQWQNHFVRATGLSLVTYEVDDIDIESFVASPAYKDHPPRIVIYETVERSFVDRCPQWNKGDCRTAPNPVFKKPHLKFRSGNQLLSAHTRNTQNGPLHPNLSSGVHFLKRSIKKAFNQKSHQVIKIALSRNDLFSNRQSGHLLVYRHDFKRYQVSKEDLDGAVCGLSYIQNTFQKNGKTFFIGMVAPDKLTAYMNVYKNFDREKIYWMKDIEKHPELNVPNLNVALSNDIARGVRDVYLPNDTHWGSAGQRIVARTLIKYLTQKKALSAQP